MGIPLYPHLVLLTLLGNSAARSWTDIELLHSAEEVDMSGILYLREQDPYYINTPPPTVAPTSASSASRPTYSSKPTATPSAAPTSIPTSAPSSKPTESPDPYPENEPPFIPDPGYFNYDTSRDARYGPGYPGLVNGDKGMVVGYKNNGWVNAKEPPYPRSTWIEFSDNGYGTWKGVLGNRDPLSNQCGRVGRQSPIDLRESGASCDEHHEVRTRPGDFRITGTSVLKLIQSNKLRLKYMRRNCKDMSDIRCQEPDPPHADFPNGWGGFADVMHVDFKIPGEHWIEGEKFDGEMQIFHLHPGRRLMPTSSVLIRAKDDGYNYYFEEALKAFEKQYNWDYAMCQAKNRRERQLVSEIDQIAKGSKVEHYRDNGEWDELSIDMDNVDLDEMKRDLDRSLQIGVWDPHHEMLIPSIHFWRYDGSITEPPCGEWVTWFVSDKPMIIGTDQLERMKRVLFTHVDTECRRTSVHSEQSVARPIQDSAGRPVWKCRRSDFGPDK